VASRLQKNLPLISRVKGFLFFFFRISCLSTSCLGGPGLLELIPKALKQAS
jgi:hypothetical protein